MNTWKTTIWFFGISFCLIVNLASAVTIDYNTTGTTVNRSVLGHSWGFAGSRAIATSHRGLAGGLNADTYNWKNLTGNHSAYDDPGNYTLDFLKSARDRDAELLFTVNVRGTGSVSDKNFTYTDNTSPHLVPLARDWVRYVNFTVQNYRQGDTLTGRDYDVVYGYSPYYQSITWSPYLLSTSEWVTPKAVYWEIGNEPEISMGIFYPVDGSSVPVDYQNRYYEITQAMRAEDSTIKVGPCITTITSGQSNCVRDMLNNASCHMDFISYHPYDNLGAAWNNISSMESELRGVKGLQTTKFNDLNSTLTAAGRNAGAIEKIASEWNPVGWNFTANNEQKSQYQALGVAETVFTFVEKGLRAAHFWMDTKETAAEWPSYRIFRELKSKLGDKLITSYTDGSNGRLYVSKNTQTGRLVVWGLNFANSSTKNFSLSITNLPLTDRVYYYMNLGRTSWNNTRLMDYNDAANPNNILWTYSSVPNLYLPSFTMTVPTSGIHVLVLQPRAKNDFDGDGRTDHMIRRLESGNIHWYVKKSDGSGTIDQTWGYSSDTLLSGDFDGDGLTDYTVFRPSTSEWCILKSSGGSEYPLWGASGDIPICGNYDLDSKTDKAVVRNNGSDGYDWYISRSGGSGTLIRTWGRPSKGDIPITGDWDGDKISDIAIYRPATATAGGRWCILTSSSGFNSYIDPAGNYSYLTWGAYNVGDTPVPGHYDGDGKTDLAIYRASNGTWRIALSSDYPSGWPATPNGYNYGVHGGGANDVPVTGDFDGDGLTDFTYMRPDGSSNYVWYVKESLGNYCDIVNTTWGRSNLGDEPVAPTKQYK